MKIKVKILVILNLLCLLIFNNKELKAQCSAPPIFFIPVVTPEDTLCAADGAFLSWFTFNTDSIFVNFGDGNQLDTTNVSGLAVINHNYLPGVYFFSFEAFNACGTVFILDTIHVFSSPIANFNFSSSSLCAGATINFTDLSLTNGPNPLTNWSWTFDDGIVVNTQNATHVFETNSDYIITLDISNGQCISSFKDTLSIVSDTNLATFNYTENCPCNNLTFIPTGTASSFLWNFGDGITSSMGSPTHIFNTPSIHYVTLTGSDANGCIYKKTKELDICLNESLYFSSSSNNNWRFSDKSGVNFTSGFPVAVTNAQGSGVEGAATISHPKTGNHLFYNISSVVFNRNNIPMPNGAGLSSASAVQGSLILPFPGDTNKYYIFSQLGITSGQLGSVHYSIVDMTLNGGLGDIPVGQKNILLTNTNQTEAMSATIRRKELCSASAEYWVVIPTNDGELSVFLVSNAGISLHNVQNYTNSFQTNLPIGSAFSKSGNLYYYNSILFEFNPITGFFKPNYRKLNIVSGYSVAFSENEKFLYISDLSTLRQYDLSANLVSATETNYGNNKTTSLWIGDDNKLYFNRDNIGFLGVINNPNVQGIGANVVNNGVSLAGKLGGFSLQNIVKLFLPKQDTLNTPFTVNVSCLDANFIDNNYSDTCSFGYANSNFQWNFGDGSPVDTTRNPSHTFPLAGNYTVQLIVNRPFMCTSDTIVQNVVTNCPLPIELLTFDATPENNSRVGLNWTTVTEINNDFFTLERSIDAVNFEQFKTRQGAGNSNNIINYVDYDAHPYRGVSYYRLKQTDFNGDFSYSDIRVVFLDDLEIINLYPNPAQGQLTLSIGSSSDDVLTLRVVDVLGRTLISEQHNIKKGVNTININTAHLSGGTYIVKATNKKGSFTRKEFVKTI